MKHVCKNLQHQGKALRGVLAFLNEKGATDIQVQRNKTVQLSFALSGNPFRVSLGPSARDESAEKLTIRAINHKLRLAGLPLPAGI